MIDIKRFFITRIGPRYARFLKKYGPRKVRVLGRTYIVYKNVCNPRFFAASEYMARNVNVKENDDVLDMGTGSGILAITAAQVARRVIATDISADAVRCARDNVQRNHLENVSVLRGDLFAPIPPGQRFDVILVHPPFTERRTGTLLYKPGYDPDRSFARRFFSEAKDYLKNEGHVQIIYPSYAEPQRLLAIAHENGWKVRKIAQEDKRFYSLYIFRCSPGTGGSI